MHNLLKDSALGMKQLCRFLSYISPYIAPIEGRKKSIFLTRNKREISPT